MEGSGSSVQPPGTARAAPTTAANAVASSLASDSVIQRLTKHGVPAAYLDLGQSKFLDYVKEDRSRVPTLIATLLPDVDDVKELSSPPDEVQGAACRREFHRQCREALSWAQWLMFEGDPKVALANTGQLNGGTRGVCGAVWGRDDIAYRCQTCEHDPTCAICMPCFQAGDHRTHDYSMIHTGGGCCDCGDVTAWKQSGFCSRHRGPGQVPALPATLVATASPVLEALLSVWGLRLLAAQSVAEGKPKRWTAQTAEEKVAAQTSLAIISMLLEFCNCSESMLSFTAKLVGMQRLGILDTLLMTECFLPKPVVDALHELLYKLLGDSNFKYSFAQAFIKHYPKFLRDSVQEELATSSTGGSNNKYRDHAILGNFSVQIFTVPTLTPKLVLESKLLDMLLETLKEFFLACVGEDGRLMVSKGPIVSKLYLRVLEDIRYVMSHLEVAQYVACQRSDLAKGWLELLAFVQGMYPQHRITNIHVEEENEDWGAAYFFEVVMATIHSLFVTGAASAASVEFVEEQVPYDHENLEKVVPDDDGDIVRHTKLGRISKEMDMNLRTSGANAGMNDVTNASCARGEDPQSKDAIESRRQKDGGPARGIAGASVPASLLWLISECCSVLDRWLALDSARELTKSVGQSSVNAVQRRGSLWRGRGARVTYRGALIIRATETTPLAVDFEGGPGRGVTTRERLWRGRRVHGLEAQRDVPEEEQAGRTPATALGNGQEPADMDIDKGTISQGCRPRESPGVEWWMGSEPITPGAVSHLPGEQWPAIEFDVSRQDVSFHIPLHRMLSLLLHKSMETQAAIVDSSAVSGRVVSDHGLCDVTLLQLLPERYRGPGFWAFLMEHPLRLQVLCAQVQAGMWRRNGRSASGLCDLYRTVHWCEDTLELDLLMLQCCAVMAPAEEFVERILLRFGLTDYFKLFLWRPDEYEPSLAQEFLVLLIRLCSERGFCGLSTVESLRRELVQRLAVGDTTHSMLVKALPRRLQDCKDLQECLNSVATYRNPSGMQQGKYVLHEECWQELDLYHPRWSPRELQSAEDRYFQACKASAVYRQLPQWRMPFGPLKGLGRFIISAKVHDVLRCIFFHSAFSDNLSESRAPEGLLFNALHLLALGLDVCSLDLYKHGSTDGLSAQECPVSGQSDSTCATACDAAEKPPLLIRSTERVCVSDANGTVMPEKQSTLSLLVLLASKYGSGSGTLGTAVDTSQYSAGDLIKNLLRKFADLQRECMYEIESLLPEVLLSHSPAVEPDEQQQSVSDAERRKALARKRQLAVMANMKAAQARFVASLQETEIINQSDIGVAAGKDSTESSETCHASEENMGNLCALCRESGSASPLCFLTLVQKSKLVGIAEQVTPSWDSGSVEGAPVLAGKAADSSGSISESGRFEMYTTAELWNWIQEALGDAAMRERLLEGEALLEVVRNGLQPGIRNVVRLANSVNHFRVVDPVESVETELEDAVYSGGANEFDVLPQLLNLKTWWEQDLAGLNQDDVTCREVKLATVLAEYVAGVSKERRRQGESESLRTNDLESPREGAGVRGRRTSGRNGPETSSSKGFGMNDKAGVYLSACGHAVHQDCLDRYFSSLLQRYYSRSPFEGVTIVNPDMGEFLCPVCRRLANSILPVLPESTGPSVATKQCLVDYTKESLPGLLPAESYFGCGSLSSLQLKQALSLIFNAELVVSKAGFRKAVRTQLPDSIKGALETLAVRLLGLFYPDKDHLNNQVQGQVSQSLHLWDVFRYSLLSSELASRAPMGGPFLQGSLGGLVLLQEAADATKGSVLPLLLHAAKAVQSQSRQVVLLRARGMQLLVDSIYLGVSTDLSSDTSVSGNFPSILQYLEKGQDFADVQFWKRLADPVLLHDPMSSLIWLLFCLPLPLPSEGGPLMALIHLFYLVCIVQAITYTGSGLATATELGPPARAFVTKLQAEGCEFPSGPPLAVVRRWTLPYLRRCVLLQNLFCQPDEVLPTARVCLWELSQRHGSTPALEESGSLDLMLQQEMEEVGELEKFFGLPSLPTLLEDQTVQAVAMKWCQHLRAETGALGKRIPYPVTAAPFKLMKLPYLFQDLVQRFVKERCVRCDTVPDKPALCLLCGMLCCGITQRPCCSVNRQGECYRHAMACGAGVGVFLMLRRTNILLQRCERQAMWPSPYLDAFGEEDLEGRGKPLYLSEERYAALTAMVASHGLDYSSLVLSQTTRESQF